MFGITETDGPSRPGVVLVSTSIAGPTSPSFPEGLPHLRTEAEVRSARQPRELPKCCPFCGVDPLPARLTNYGWYLVGCENELCAVEPQCTATSVAEAWRRWNERAKA